MGRKRQPTGKKTKNKKLHVHDKTAKPPVCLSSSVSSTVGDYPALSLRLY